MDVTVTNPIGTSPAAAGDQFRYDAVPTVTSVSPNAGRTGGANAVTITGTGFTGASAVDFGGTPATAFSVNSDTSITAGSPAGSVGTVDITVTTPGGTSATSVADQFSYVLPATVSSVSPNAGPTAGGTSVTVTGTGFTTATAVHFGGTAATTFTVNSPTTISVVSPAGSAGTVDITVTNAGGTSTTSPADRFTYDAVPTVTAVLPNAGPTAGGATVTITGTGFTGATAVNFGGTAATSFTVHSTTSISAVSPAGSVGTVVDITVTTPGGTSATSSADRFTYVAAPTVTALSATSGPAAGGTTVTITGTGFTGTTAVHFGGTAAAAFVVNSSTTISAVSPAVSAGTVDVTVTNPGGTSVSSSVDQFTYIAAPVVTSVSPNAGPTLGGTTVTITGTGFTGATSVDFGHAAATFTVDSPTTITAVSRGGPAGTVDITVTTPGGESDTSPADQFTYDAAPTVTFIIPNQGPTAGGHTVTVFGAHLGSATAVNFGSAAGTTFTTSTTALTVITPPGTGTVNVTVTTPGGTSGTSSTTRYTYDPVPTVTGITPSAGLPAGGNSVTITGTGFTATTNVQFGAGHYGTGYFFRSSTLLTVTVPTGSAGPVDVILTTPGGSVTDTNGYTYGTPPTVTSLSTATGSTAGGTTVTIAGTHLGATTSVTFGGAAATGLTLTSTTSITLTTPAHAVGTVDVMVITPFGSATDANAFTYGPPPTITTISPAAGPTAGGNTVQITGTNFVVGQTTVGTGGSFGTIATMTTTTITVVVPAYTSGEANPVPVTVTTPYGSVTRTGAYTYVAAPTITSLTPTTGIGSGGYQITIEGANFTTDGVGVTRVTFGTGNPAPVVDVVSSTELVATVPANPVTAPPTAATFVPLTVTTPGGKSSPLTFGYNT